MKTLSIFHGILLCVLTSALAVADPALSVEQALETLRQIEDLEGDARVSPETYRERAKVLAEGLVAELGEEDFLVGCIEASAAAFRIQAGIEECYRPFFLLEAVPLPSARMVATLAPLWSDADPALQKVISKCLGPIES